MPTPNGDDSLQTTDHVLVPESGTSPESGEAPCRDGKATVSFPSTQPESGDSESAAPSELPSIPGYEIEGVLGRGGMGVVYRARHLALKRPVALKMILGDVSDEERQRFQAEAEAAARLRHPGIVQVYDIGAADGLPYLALEFVAGGTL